MFFFMPMYSILLIYIGAAIIPAMILMRYIYKMDTYEKEPPALLWSLIWCGVLAALVSIVLEIIGEGLLGLTKLDKDSPLYSIVTAFFVVAVVEEGTKYFFMARKTWNDPNFNYSFDGIVYAAFTSLGFAAFENVKYVFNYGLSVAFPRAILAIPGHLGFSVVFGFFYGRARKAADYGRDGQKVADLILGYVCAVFLHGFYDSCAMIQTSGSTIVFVAFVAIMYVVIYFLIRHESDHNAPV
ncbi:MAG: PrsW family glutamic-type intramembrane protease [Lachnospiraceae bacterium]|nr:PrsW family glutamic-type intramembrane protease [Lachnospiraceae bacterium]